MYCALDVENLGMTVLKRCVNMDSGNDKKRRTYISYVLKSECWLMYYRTYFAMYPNLENHHEYVLALRLWKLQMIHVAKNLSRIEEAEWCWSSIESGWASRCG